MTERQSKTTQERHERILNELVKMPGNDLCADCGTKNPRWASYSLGVFLCIRCAGIHRKMGTHISKIKSITMDQWTVEQIDVRDTKGNYALINCAI
ncbi:Arf GTPase activating protein [Rhizopus microsporus ATCC 52813]|uniref:Arf GTPase activating protein n=1 Tax=Rhizopus microsporus ATCC 52813 TaxID=1340429 RepID=A0A2G4SN44_RHIZD|nr:Arf GTPase activating protein [Rhizopus microsporus ATCC 52813]PHZ10184.1 Arf GTPase activating protein [Rhizopus microsporus ATCC 52813]